MRKASGDEVAPARPASLAIQQKGNLPLHKGLELLSHYGVTPVRGSLAANQEEAAEKADALGYPVVLKVAAPELPHKTDLGLVKMGLGSRSQVQSAFSQLQEKLEAHKEKVSTRAILVQEMVKGGVEVILGVKRDPQFGPVLLLGLGGIFTEIMQDFSLRVCPVSGNDIEEMLRELKGWRLLEGFRGAATSDIGALNGAIVSVARMAMALREHLVELDINPLFVLPEGQGVRAADALVVLD
jgi:acetyltransferase